MLLFACGGWVWELYVYGVVFLFVGAGDGDHGEKMGHLRCLI